MRKLASIQIITDISPIPEADRIEVATVLGWKVVINKKDNFKVGDKIVYFEIDSILPEKPEFEFLRESKFRIRTRKFKKQVSQGLVMPLDIIPAEWRFRGDFIGQDVTTVLGVKKYDPELEIEKASSNSSNNVLISFLLKYNWFRKIWNPKKTKGFPSFISKTDEDRIQLFPNICNDFKNIEFTVTEKLDGQSCTVFLKRTGNIFNPFEFGVCSRTMRRGKKDESNYWKVAIKYDLENVLKKIIGEHDWVAIQGEILAQNVQGNKYRFDEKDSPSLFVFNVLFPDYKLNSNDGSKLMHEFYIPFVPILDSWCLPSTIDEAVEFSKGNSVLVRSPREGVVVRNHENNISFKIINPDFLLKWSL